ncbi:MAG TPA: hypothetical protein VH229_09555 [Candidatus Udaeobacter sp.]|nr:hypothetical protein [Candidatus Udaeobacter sp.]
MTEGRFRRRHRVLPAVAVASVSDGEVRVEMSRSRIGQLPLLAHPQAAVSDKTQDTRADDERGRAGIRGDQSPAMTLPTGLGSVPE